MAEDILSNVNVLIKISINTY